MFVDLLRSSVFLEAAIEAHRDIKMKGLHSHSCYSPPTANLILIPTPLSTGEHMP